MSATSKIDDMVPRVRLMSLSNLIWQHTARSLAREVVMEHGTSTFCIFVMKWLINYFLPFFFFEGVFWLLVGLTKDDRPMDILY